MALIGLLKKYRLEGVYVNGNVLYAYPVRIHSIYRSGNLSIGQVQVFLHVCLSDQDRYTLLSIKLF